MNISLLSQAVGTSTDPLENAQEQIKEAETFFNQMINAFVGYLPNTDSRNSYFQARAENDEQGYET